MITYFPDPEKLKKAKSINPYADIISWFAAGNTISLIDDLSLGEYKKSLESVPGLKNVIKQFKYKLIITTVEYKISHLYRISSTFHSSAIPINYLPITLHFKVR